MAAFAYVDGFVFTTGANFRAGNVELERAGIAEMVILPSDENFEDGEGVEGVELLGSQGRLILCY